LFSSVDDDDDDEDSADDAEEARRMGKDGWDLDVVTEYCRVLEEGAKAEEKELKRTSTASSRNAVAVDEGIAEIFIVAAVYCVCFLNIFGSSHVALR